MMGSRQMRYENGIRGQVWTCEARSKYGVRPVVHEIPNRLNIEAKSLDLTNQLSLIGVYLGIEWG